MAAPCTIEFLSEVFLGGPGDPSGSLGLSDLHLFVPIPHTGAVIQADFDLNLSEKPFFLGDQLEERPFRFSEPRAVCYAPRKGFYVCDARSEHILFFDETGRFEYAKSPPGLLETSFRRPVGISLEAGSLAVMDSRSVLHIIGPKGERARFALRAHLEDLNTERLGLQWHEGMLYLIAGKHKIFWLDPGSRSRKGVIDLLKLVQGQIESFCFDGMGRAFVLVSRTPALWVVDESFTRMLGTYEEVGYGEGQLRHPKAIRADGQGGLFLLDDKRILKLRVLEKPADAEGEEAEEHEAEDVGQT